MNLYSRARKYIDMNRVKELREEKIKKRKLAEKVKEQERIFAEMHKIELETDPKFCNWKRELEEAMSTGALGMINLEAEDEALENIDISSSTESSINASVTSGGSGTGYNTGLNMGTEMISISGATSAKTFTLGTVDTSKATTITFKHLQGDYNNGGMASQSDTDVFYQDEDGGLHLIKTIERNYVGYFVHSGEDHPDHPFKAGLFDTMSASQEADLRSDYSDWVSGGFQAAVQFQIFGKIVRYLGDQEQITTHTYNVPPGARGKGKIIIAQGENVGSSWTNDVGFSNFEVKRNFPINLFVPLDDPDSLPFHRGGLAGSEERRKQLQDMLEAGNEWMARNGLDPSKTSPGDIQLANAGPSTPVKTDSDGRIVPNQGGGRPGNVRLKPGMLPRADAGGTQVADGRRTSPTATDPPAAVRDAYNMRWDPVMKTWAPNRA